MNKVVRIGTRDSELAVWQANLVKQLLEQNGTACELVYIKSEGDIDLKTPLYAMGVQGVFTRSLDIALLNNTIDIAVHSMKDVPIQLPQTIVKAAVLERANYKDLFVYKPTEGADSKLLAAVKAGAVSANSTLHLSITIGSSSIRRKAQWLHHFPQTQIENLRGNVNTRLRKVAESSWNGAVFAAAGLERINVKPAHSFELDWMLPAPAQGAIMVVCREVDESVLNACKVLHHTPTDICVQAERDFLKTLMGGCSTPIAALAQIQNNEVVFKGNILSLDGVKKIEVQKVCSVAEAQHIGVIAAQEILHNGGKQLVEEMQYAKK